MGQLGTNTICCQWHARPPRDDLDSRYKLNYRAAPDRMKHITEQMSSVLPTYPYSSSDLRAGAMS